MRSGMLAAVTGALVSKSSMFVAVSGGSCLWMAKRHLELIAGYETVMDKVDLMGDIHEAGGYVMVPASFFAKPRPPVNLFLPRIFQRHSYVFPAVLPGPAAGPTGGPTTFLPSSLMDPTTVLPLPAPTTVLPPPTVLSPPTTILSPPTTAVPASPTEVLPPPTTILSPPPPTNTTAGDGEGNDA